MSLFFNFPVVCPPNPDVGFCSNKRTALSLASLYLSNTQTLPHGAPKGERENKKPLDL